jgi:hypothetical protein
MKRRYKILVGLVFFIFCVFISKETRIDKQNIRRVIHINIVPKVIDETDRFLRLMSLKESHGKVNVVSKSGYLGLYQFHPKTLKEIGVHVTNKKFLNDKNLQDRAMIRYLKLNKQELRQEIRKYSGRKIKGKPITESGILAGAHLLGSHNVKSYLKSGHDLSDANGIKISHYIRKFSGYKLNLTIK